MYPGRTTSTLIRGIVDGIGASTDLSPYIDAANELVSERCVPLTDANNNAAYNDHRLELIERWLSAHFYAIFDQDPNADMDVVEEIRTRYRGRSDLGLNSTIYGQQAMRLDTYGGLAVMDNGQKKYAKVPRAVIQGVSIGVTWLGSRHRRCPGIGPGSFGP